MELRLPNITATDTAGRLNQLQRYLYALVEQLNWEMGTASSLPATQSVTVPKAAPEETFSAIKSLIIKSADIIEAYSDKITQTLEGKYVAQSQFGTFTEETNQVLEQTATNVEQLFSNLQRMESSLGGIESTLIGVNAYLRSGLLYYDESGVPIYGLEVGQQTQVDGETVFNKYARFTAGKLSFYDANDNEVAYISDYKLHITNVEVGGTLRQGHFQDSTQADGSIVTKFFR